VLGGAKTITMGTYYALCLVFLALSSVVSDPVIPSLQFSYSTGLFDTGSYPSISYIPQSDFGKFLEVNSQNPRLPEPNNRLCLTPGCVRAAAELIKQMDSTADPCKDFFQFACGGYVEETVLPEHKSRLGKFSGLRDQLYLRLRRIFESGSEVGEPQVYSSVRNLYKTCMDKKSIEERSLDDLHDIVGRLGGWPVVQGDSWSGDDFRWYEMATKARGEGFDYNQMMSVDIFVDPKDSEKRIIEIDQAQFGLDREYLTKGFDDKDVQAYYKYMVRTAVFMGAEEEVAKEEMKQALDFELKLAEISLPREERRNKTALYNPMTLNEAANQLYPEMPFVKYINNLHGSEDVVHDGAEVVNVKVPKYITDFREHIFQVPSRVQANYIMWRVVKSAMNFMNEEASEIQLEYNKVITGKAQKAPRWEKCVESTAGLKKPNLYFEEGSLSNAVGGMYAKKHFDLGAKEIADEIVENVRSEFKKMLDELTWMDPTTKAKAHIKVDQITPHMAYAKEILDTKLIDEFYNGLYLQQDSYLKNILRLKKFIYDYHIREFRNPIDKQSWKTHGGAAIVNAFYSPEENSIQFPAGILEGVFFQKDRPLYMNYGGIGFVVGHEITHGFDDEGSQYDGHGNLVGWWEPQTKSRYLEKAQCIIDQYGNYTVEVEGEVLNVNGITTQGENIADNGGIKEAFGAYETLVSKYGPEPKLPGLEYTPRQLMWLSGASVWCEVRRPASLKQQVLTDPHSPARFRINGPFSNMPSFGDDWGCPVGSPMNPVKKCSVW